MGGKKTFSNCDGIKINLHITWDYYTLRESTMIRNVAKSPWDRTWMGTQGTLHVWSQWNHCPLVSPPEYQSVNVRSPAGSSLQHHVEQRAPDVLCCLYGAGSRVTQAGPELGHVAEDGFGLLILLLLPLKCWDYRCVTASLSVLDFIGYLWPLANRFFHPTLN